MRLKFRRGYGKGVRDPMRAKIWKFRRRVPNPQKEDCNINGISMPSLDLQVRYEYAGGANLPPPPASDLPEGVVTVQQAVSTKPVKRISSGLPWMDAILGGGFAEGTVVMLVGDPGAGKSTLLAQVLHSNLSSLYSTAEESADQVAQRCKRLGLREDIKIMENDNILEILSAARKLKAQLVVVDSVQTVKHPRAKGDAGNGNQVVAVARAASDFAKVTGACVILVCQVIKSGRYAGPSTLEHAVDVSLRLVNGYQGKKIVASKNRYGRTDIEIPVKMTERGLAGPGPNPTIQAAGLPELKTDQPKSQTFTIVVSFIILYILFTGIGLLVFGGIMHHSLPIYKS